uniref:Trypsin-like peptidase domain-containing protein n=1 Tax=Bradyrhizobium barranii subsp. barranii TaxID=2823807 RepID=A0A7Z0TNF7_9BRAD
MAGVANVFEQRAWLARIWSNEKRASLVGTAFAIDKRHLLTCHHVVHEAGATIPGGRVYLDFPLTNKTGIWCTVLADGWCPTPAKDDAQSAGDLALLKIDDGLPDLAPLPLRLRKSYAGLAAMASPSSTRKGMPHTARSALWLALSGCGWRRPPRPCCSQDSAAHPYSWKSWKGLSASS